MVTNNHHTNNSTTTYTNNNSGNVSSNPFKRLFRLSKDHHHHHNHHHMSHHQSNLHHDKHVEDEEKYETSSCTCCQHIETVENIIIKEETIEDYLPSSSSVISSFTMLNSNKRRFSMTNHGSISSQIISSNDKTANEKKKEKKRKLKKQNKIFHFFKGHATNDNINQTNTTTASTTSNQLIEPSKSKLNKSKSIELDFDFNIVDKPITSNTCYMTNCLTTSSVDYSTNNNTFSSTNVNNNNTTTTTYETPLDRILLLNEVTKLTSPLSKNVSPNNQLQRGKVLKVTSNENLFFLQPLKSKNSSISTGDKRRRVGDDNSESMILSDGISPTNSFTVLSDEPMVTSPKLDQSFVEEFL